MRRGRTKTTTRPIDTDPRWCSRHSPCVHCEFAPTCLVSRWLPSTDARLLCCARLCCCSMVDPKPHLLFHPAHPSTTPDRLGWSLCLRLLQRQRGRFGPYFGAKYTPPPFFLLRSRAAWRHEHPAGVLCRPYDRGCTAYPPWLSCRRLRALFAHLRCVRRTNLA